MNYYIELTLINNNDLSFTKLWTSIYTQLHLAFVQQKDPNEQIPYGISFPEYKSVEIKGKQLNLLGSKLRIFAESEHVLQKLNLDKSLERLTDYVHLKSIKPVGNVVQYLTVSRCRPQASAVNLARRYAKRHHISIEDALKRLEGFEQIFEDSPYLHLKSFSGNRDFSMCIKQTRLGEPSNGLFSTYGLSAKSTVPHW